MKGKMIYDFVSFIFVRIIFFYLQIFVKIG